MRMQYFDDRLGVIRDVLRVQKVGIGTSRMLRVRLGAVSQHPAEAVTVTPDVYDRNIVRVAQRSTP